MSQCLGLYIEKKLIKYAKVSKNNDTVKVESFGIKFYDNLEETIKQIIEETYSFKVPISINLVEEKYNDFQVFSLLSKKDMEGVIKTEFESICYDKDENPSIYEQRYIVSNSNLENDKIKIINISAPKTAITQRKNQLSEYKINSILPIGVTIPNLLGDQSKSTVVIVNIEKDTTITKVHKNAVSDIIVLPIGAQKIIEEINKEENSYSKAYEICKNSTIYTENDKDLQYEENEYLTDIMPVLYQIVSEVRNVVSQSLEKIDKVYITGTASIINNIDIYFQEYMREVGCEVLKPSFINNNSKLNIKDYIEVNSAISLGLQGLEKNNSVNFTKESIADKTSDLFKTELFKGDFLNKSVTLGGISEFLNKYNRQYNITFITFALIVLFYFVGGFIMNKQLDNKMGIAELSINTTNERISQIKTYSSEFEQKTSDYERLIRSIQNINDVNSEDKRYRNTIPNLLNNIMAIIPKSVQLTLIQNTSDNHIVIQAQSPIYEQVAFFKTKLKTEGVLKNVVSDTGVMQGSYLSVTIEGELP